MDAFQTQRRNNSMTQDRSILMEIKGLDSEEWEAELTQRKFSRCSSEEEWEEWVVWEETWEDSAALAMVEENKASLLGLDDLLCIIIQWLLEDWW